ncbi:hypothetical protein MCOR27_008862 [Pyricularia oryzae]|nr:hypothetical protein MCOR01_009928 [Pyricularia oryzae]KAI6271332.1 hypothetical protein MCOR27_008862 [Pyricularia oryzae]KAI6316794.1 hypothetical protein MCOR34_004208 [Pyricularia oryzae]KAI6372382.1 hypothetical protein MCOR31_003684 [Pyricularia oryzae]KAI6392387.1 hypothetical protein MCOR23_008509 [Pyricularia oryzae]
MCGPGASTQKTTQVVTGAIPMFLAGAVVFSSYVVIDKVCYGHFYSQGWTRTAHAITAILAISLLFMTLSYMRLFHMIVRNPGLVPSPKHDAKSQDPEAPHDMTSPSESRPGGRIINGPGDPEVQLNEIPSLRPDRPELEVFYGLEAFVCDAYGKPRYCTNCATWKPDRAHHSGEIGRCVRKMDHYCPWVGGMVAETSFKFFVQFVFYATVFCTICLVPAAIVLNAQMRSGLGVDPMVCVVVGLGAFFGLFSSTMTFNCMRFLALNTTNIDAIDYDSKCYRLAIRVPDEDATHRGAVFCPVVSFPLHRDAFRPRWAERDIGPDDETDEQRDERWARLDRQAGEQSARTRAHIAPAARRRYYAVVTTKPGENPWHMGSVYLNICSVMGNRVFDWFLPMRQSPCINEQSDQGFYRFGPLLETLRSRHGLRRPDEAVEECEKTSLI